MVVPVAVGERSLGAVLLGHAVLLRVEPRNGLRVLVVLGLLGQSSPFRAFGLKLRNQANRTWTCVHAYIQTLHGPVAFPLQLDSTVPINVRILTEANRGHSSAARSSPPGGGRGPAEQPHLKCKSSGGARAASVVDAKWDDGVFLSTSLTSQVDLTVQLSRV
ncbi:hypothetical protein GCM10022255_113800 [Dactylosporangium darangshiense]|uniref:Uncharacterized protein n=1 Tax=Dactylosporangium darangshiense TaxID=579108 RepID=A0ABP8DVJ9_9ACTN